MVLKTQQGSKELVSLVKHDLYYIFIFQRISFCENHQALAIEINKSRTINLEISDKDNDSPYHNFELSRRLYWLDVLNYHGNMIQK